MLAMDNRQITTSWFVGILEGESNFENRKDRSMYLRITNTDLDLIKACESYLKNNSILFETKEDSKKTKGHKRVYRIYVCSVDCYNLYKTIESKLECRRNEFQRTVGISETICSASIDLDWLIGIWEAEGSFYMSESHKGHIQPYIRINNTNQQIIKKIAYNIKNLGCSWHTQNFIPDVKKPYTQININGMMRCKRFLRKTENLWISNRNLLRTNLISEYIESRLSKPQIEPYSQKELEIYRRVKELNL